MRSAQLPNSNIHLASRNSYLGIIALVRAVVLKFTGDPHHQLDGVLEGEAARVDDMVERIKHAAD